MCVGLGLALTLTKKGGHGNLLDENKGRSFHENNRSLGLGKFHVFDAPKHEFQ